MQDEVTKHTRKIYDVAKNSKHAFGEKAKEIVIEIFIIVFAVTLSIWLHGWSEHRHQQKETKEFLADLKEDLLSDIASMEKANDELAKSAKSFLFLQRLTKERMDSLRDAKAPLNFYSNLGTTKINSGNYEGFKSSGKIGFIENKELKKLILKYYQDATPSVLEAEKINASLLMKILDHWTESSDQDIQKRMLSSKLKALLRPFHDIAKNSLVLYQDAIAMAKKIIDDIDKDNSR
jgi:hypothetical protein